MRKLALILAVVASLVGTASAQAWQQTYLGQNCGVPLVKRDDPFSLPKPKSTVRPVLYYANCASRFHLEGHGLSWRGWGSAQASGSGKIAVSYENPPGSKDLATWRRYKGHVTAYRPRYCPDGTRIYTRVRWVQTAPARWHGRPRNSSATVIQNVEPCATYKDSYGDYQTAIATRTAVPATQQEVHQLAFTRVVAKFGGTWQNGSPIQSGEIVCVSEDNYDPYSDDEPAVLFDMSPNEAYAWACLYGPGDERIGSIEVMAANHVYSTTMRE